MLISCSKCGRTHNRGYKCRAGGRLPQTDEQALRSRYKWTKKSGDIRERSFHLCAICKELGDYSPKEVEVHHIIKLKENPSLLLEDSNLITLCVDHHKAADRGEIDIDYLRELVSKRDSRDVSDV